MCIIRRKQVLATMQRSGTFVARLQECKMAQPLWKSLEVPQKIIERTIIRPRKYSFEFMSKGDKMRMSRRYLQSHIHCCILHNNQDRKTAQCSWADKSIKKMWCKHTLQYDSAFKNEGYLVICSSMNEAGGIGKSYISQSQEEKYCTVPIT